jgi:hypothetical protein
MARENQLENDLWTMILEMEIQFVRTQEFFESFVRTKKGVFHGFLGF